MPRIQPNLSPSTESQALLDQVKASLGSTPNIFTTMAHSPATLGFYLAGSGALKKTKLSATLREQLAIAVAGQNGCDYCASAHTAIGKMQKLDPKELTENLAGSSSDLKTHAALTFARALIEGRGHVKDADFLAVRDAGYSDAEITEIVAVVGINLFTNYFNLAFGTEVDFPLVSTGKETSQAA